MITEKMKAVEYCDHVKESFLCNKCSNNNRICCASL